MSVIKDTKEFRVFNCKKDSGQIVTIRVRKANRSELETADMEQGRIYNQSLLAGLPPRMRMLRKLREQGLWTGDDDLALNELREAVARLDLQIADQTKKLEDAPDEAKDEITAVKEGFVKDRAEAFRKLNGLRMEIDGMLGHTSDAKAEDAQRNFLLACVAELVKADGENFKAVSRVWGSVDALMSEQDNNLLQRVIYEHMTFNAGLPSEWDVDIKASEPAPTKNDTADATTPAGGNEGEKQGSNASAIESL